MLEKVTLKTVIPKGDRVLVHIQRLPKTTESGLYVGTTNEFSSNRMDIDNYTAEVISLGDPAKVEEGCPGLEVGDRVIFSQFAGYHMPTGRDVYSKVIHASDIHCKLKDSMKLKLEDAQPQGERLLLQVVEYDEHTVNGIIVPKKESDPRELDTEECVVRGIGPKAGDDYKVGDVVYIPGYVGNTVILDNGMTVKTVNYTDILFAIK